MRTSEPFVAKSLRSFENYGVFTRTGEGAEVVRTLFKMGGSIFYDFVLMYGRKL